MGVTHPPTPHFPYCTADTAQLKPVVGVILKVRFGVKAYLHYLQVMGSSFVHIQTRARSAAALFHILSARPRSLETDAEGRVCVSNEAKLG